MAITCLGKIYLLICICLINLNFSKMIVYLSLKISSEVILPIRSQLYLVFLNPVTMIVNVFFGGGSCILLGAVSIKFYRFCKFLIFSISIFSISSYFSGRQKWPPLTESNQRSMMVMSTIDGKIIYNLYFIVYVMIRWYVS